MKKIIKRKQINKEIKKISKRISNDYENKNLVIIGVLKGCFMFLSDLIKELDNMNIEIEFIQLSSYEFSESTGDVKVISDIKTNLCNKNILIVEDIIDTGLTLKKLYDILQKHKPYTIKTCCLINKKIKRKVNLHPNYYCFEINDKFVIGYGLDCNEKFRNLLDIYEI